MIENDRKVFAELFRQVGSAMECGIDHQKARDPQFAEKVVAMARDGFRFRMVIERKPDCQARLEMIRVDGDSNIEAVTLFEFREDPSVEPTCNSVN